MSEHQKGFVSVPFKQMLLKRKDGLVVKTMAGIPGSIPSSSAQLSRAILIKSLNARFSRNAERLTNPAEVNQNCGCSAQMKLRLLISLCFSSSYL